MTGWLVVLFNETLSKFQPIIVFEVRKICIKVLMLALRATRFVIQSLANSSFSIWQNQILKTSQIVGKEKKGAAPYGFRRQQMGPLPLAIKNQFYENFVSN